MQSGFRRISVVSIGADNLALEKGRGSRFLRADSMDFSSRRGGIFRR
jgi:hypothetical protein